MTETIPTPPKGHRLCVGGEVIDRHTMFWDGHEWRLSIAIGCSIGTDSQYIPYAKPEEKSDEPA